MKVLAGGGQSAGVVFALADVQTQEHHVRGAQALPQSGLVFGLVTDLATAAGSHVTARR
jgi:hypothetical protein